jgi:hypothetical protein
MEASKNHLFILRAWQEGSEWRWSLMKIGEPSRLGFPDLDSLYLYLSSLTTGSMEVDRDYPREPDA